MKTKCLAFALREALFVIAVLALLVAMLLPAMKKAKTRSSRINCINNHKQISVAFRQWSLDCTDRYPMQISVTNGGTSELIVQGDVFTTFLVMSNELYTPKVLFCPGETDDRRTCATYFGFLPGPGQVPFTNNFNTSYFIGVDAEDVRPQMLLVGDSHFAIGGKRVSPGLLRLGTNSLVSWPRPIRNDHERGGNIGLADGSVMNCDDKGFRKLLQNSGDQTNRLAIP